MVGIGGVGMSAIAQILLDRGFDVSGSDVAPSAAVDRLRAAGAAVSIGHDARQVGDVRVVDDYGHHPTEVAAALETARLGAARRVIVVFQPHRYTRTRRLCERFGPALALADVVILTEVYAAGEPPVPGGDRGAIAAEIAAVSPIPVHCVDSLGDAVEVAVATARSGDVIVTLGAGTIGTIAPRIVRSLKARAS